MSNPSVFLKNVAVVDTTNGEITPGQDIRIEDGRFAQIASTGGEPPAGAKIIEGEGRSVVPGFVDMHAHALDRTDPDPILRLMFTFGVTGFRQMSGSDSVLARRAAGTLTFPADASVPVSLAGPLLSPMNANSADAAVTEIRRQKAAGADFLKIVGVSPATFTVAQAEARRQGLIIACHLPTGVDVRAASRAGIGSIEHVGAGADIPAACSSEEDSVRSRIKPLNIPLPSFKFPFMEPIMRKLLAGMVINPSQSTKSDQLVTMQRAIDTFLEEKAHALAAQFAADGTWHCPTLIRMEAQELCDAPAFRNDPDLRFMTKKTAETWKSTAKKFEKFNEDQRATFGAFYELQKRLVGIFDKEGVSLLAGSDTVGAVWVVPGSSLHREFDELAASGLSPLRVLQTATLDPARYLGINEAGRIAVGNQSDLVLLEQNPIEDVRHLHSVVGVLRGDHFASARELKSLQSELAIVGVD